MGGQKQKPIQTPFQQKQTQTNTYSPISVSETPEARALQDAPLNFGKPLKLQSAGYNEALGEQEINNRYDSAFNAGIPAWIRNMNRQKEIREVQGQGAQQGAQEAYLNQLSENDIEAKKTAADLERKRILLPQVYQTSGSGASSGYNTQLTQPTQGFWSSFGGGLGSGLGSALV